MNRDVDEVVLAAGSEIVKTAIVCPPTIIGAGRGPDNARSVQLYNATAAFLKHKQGFKVGKGENIWHHINVQDLSELYLLLGEAAVNGGSPATWNDQGYYLAENGSFVWGEVLEEVAKIAHKEGLLPDSTLKSYAPKEADQIMPFAAYMVGTNSRGVSERGKRLLGWTPKKRDIQAELVTTVESEAHLLGLKKSHAEKVQA